MTQKDETEFRDSQPSRPVLEDSELMQQDFGSMLKRCRESSGLTIERVAVATRIAHPFIEALEDGEIQRLPAKVFGRGFIRNLCKVYNQDPKPFLQAYESALKDSSLVDRDELTPTSGGRVLDSKRTIGQKRSLFSSLKHLQKWNFFAIQPRWLILAIGLVIGLLALAVWAPRMEFAALRDMWTSDQAGTTPQAASEGATQRSPVAATDTAALTPAQTQAQADKDVANADKQSEPRSAEAAKASIVDNKGALILQAAVATRIEMSIDEQPATTVELNQDSQAISFEKRLELLRPVGTESNLTISFLGKKLGDLSTGKFGRRLSFVKGAPPQPAKSSD